jgi:dihydropyrimidinase
VYDLVIRGGTVATASDVVEADVGVRDGTIVAIGTRLAPGSREIDARGRYVLPGGIDAHCHLDQPTSDGSRMADDFESGTRSAACGGTTTVIPFAAQFKGRSLQAAIEDYHQRADGRSYIDYAFHLIVSDPTPDVLGRELPMYVRRGYTSFKIYMTYDDLKLSDRELLETLAVAKATGALTMVHAENADCIAYMIEVLERSGQTAPIEHARSRPAVVEREATHRAISLAEFIDVPILLVHVSGRDATEQIAWAQRRGIRIYAETCPQYLFLTEADLDRPGFEGAKAICSPPPRGAADQDAIWNGLRNGTFQVFSSDHAPFRYDDPQGKGAANPRPFAHVPNGIPGIETRLPLLFSAGVGGGRIDLTTFVGLTSTNPAKLYGLYPRKGTIAPGADADIAIWDPARTVTITNDLLHHNVDYTPYEGMRVTGWPEITLSRGEIVQEGGIVSAAAGRGRFIPAGMPFSLSATPAALSSR